jgi:integrase
MTAYAAGLRVSELVHLKLSDINPERMMIRVQQGKGKKDRYTILSQHLLGELRRYKQAYQPVIWVFFGKAGGRRKQGTPRAGRYLSPIRGELPKHASLARLLSESDAGRFGLSDSRARRASGSMRLMRL